MKTYLLVSLSVLAGLTALSFCIGGPAPAVAADPVQHEVIASDDLHLLAGYYYQDPRHWKTIYAANRATIHASNILQPGMILTIPGEKRNTFPVPYAEWKAWVGR